MEDFHQETLTEAQQDAIFKFTKVGVNWISENTSFADVATILGNPKRKSEYVNEVSYYWFPYKSIEIKFSFEKLSRDDQQPRIKSFQILIDNNFSSDIPYAQFDAFGFHRVERGEKIDEIRIEDGNFYQPVGAFATSSAIPINETGFLYRLPRPNDSLYDIYFGLTYLADLVSEKGPWNLGNIRSATNLREVSIYRHYLTPDELNERNQAKREKYGYMNLCTGAICPETGIWEGWTTDGPTDVLHVEKGRKFDMVRAVSIAQSTAPCPMIAGQWMWLCSLEEQGGVTWNGMALKG